MTAKWKDIIPKGFDLDDVMTQTTHSEQMMRNRLRRCDFNAPLALDDAYWASNMRHRRGNLVHRGRKMTLRKYAAMLGTSQSAIRRCFAKGFTTDQVTRRVMYGNTAPRRCNEDRVEGPADWSSLGDMGPRVGLDSLPEPTKWDRRYGYGPVDPTECRI
jgi:hypothetical protein